MLWGAKSKGRGVRVDHANGYVGMSLAILTKWSFVHYTHNNLKGLDKGYLMQQGPS